MPIPDAFASNATGLKKQSICARRQRRMEKKDNPRSHQKPDAHIHNSEGESPKLTCWAPGCTADSAAAPRPAPIRGGQNPLLNRLRPGATAIRNLGWTPPPTRGSVRADARRGGSSPIPPGIHENKL